MTFDIKLTIPLITIAPENYLKLNFCGHNSNVYVSEIKHIQYKKFCLDYELCLLLSIGNQPVFYVLDSA
ncbi:hypothetical protein T4B_3466 [Trichinella pseudospiralis]|uniref:Uncharacterized protein n=1 Tax=Trichinella pseudospiralis TaxID=6337 RepID=A0A0V1GKV7_TRIPS|nr:hypothetical protein T4B_3466 [Trichinella pseudospiralis]